LTGLQVYILALVLSLLGIAVGFVLWLFSNRPFQGRSLQQLWGMIFFASIVLMGILFGSLGQWILGLFALVISVLLFVALIGRQFMSS